MPFKKVGPDRYESPSGRKLTGAQVKAYYAKKSASRKRGKAATKARKKTR